MLLVLGGVICVVLLYVLFTLGQLDDNVIYRLNRTDVVRAEDHVDCAQVFPFS